MITNVIKETWIHISNLVFTTLQQFGKITNIRVFRNNISKGPDHGR